MDERSPKLAPSGLRATDDCSKDRVASTAIYPTRRPMSTMRWEAPVEWHDSGCDARIRFARMLYPYEYLNLPMQEGHFGRPAISMISEDAPPTTTGPPFPGILATVGRLWRLATRRAQASGRATSALFGKRSRD
ncbi:hypothetical protein LMG24238_02143 [Paraburkholderia sediminicola]|uniref:Uncharacterized protein n=1 Tax=Paraburkholderia sediminicola TaxID=458836 RepID=A0A6J5APU3_9BURK|nr:hypothetical protein LMG24238_02143 [Paraburkholderia sediminicola]